ncbi:threonine dehydratase biosynthetic, chloroplastic [Solanum stenotomum]|uniref:threonine dehydratase biosynthetic, chloroplastic n=1 Tax=Solanum stenotomum TaxID=172797 RepID=UPI0020D13974|nr:threonine dehydratase biosynthetic, chloroplastic [Solanum stenotomum]
MEFLCLAPTHSFSTNPKSTKIISIDRISTTGRIMKMYQNMRGSTVRPSALPLKMSRIVTLPDISAPVVSAPAILPKVDSGELVVNKPTGGDPDELFQYLVDILASPVYDVAIESPLELATKLSTRLGVNFYIKREDKQKVFSFKLRGAYNMMSNLSKEELAKGVITASAGNHAQGVALAGQRLNCKSTIVMPETTPQIKVDAVKALGGTVVLHGQTFDEAQTYALELSEKDRLKYIPPFDAPGVIKGQGTIGTEINRQLKDIHAVFVPVGGGGLISGVAAFFKQIAPNTKIIGVEPYGAASMTLSLYEGHRVKLENVDTFADGVAVALVGEYTFAKCQELIDGMVLVGNDGISAAIKDVYDEGRNILETSGAVAIAGAAAYCEFYKIKNENIVAIASGANMDFSKLHKVTELAELGSGKEALLATFMIEQPGSFKTFAKLVGSMNITEVTYRFTSERKEALILYRVDVDEKSDLEEMIKKLNSSTMKTFNFSHNELVAEHIKHLVGGSASISDEIFGEFIFPEKAGSLSTFLEAFSPRWNITLCRYRDQGDISGNVLVGFQVPQSEMDEFKSQADGLGYPYNLDNSNEAFNIVVAE